MAASLLLVRHGQIDANRQGRWHGSTEGKLTWRGRRQARKTALHIKTAEPPIAALYSSPLDRCLKTSAYISRSLGLEINVEADLREYAIGEWEDTSFTELATRHDFFTLSRGDLSYAPPGGESLQAVSGRITHALQSINNRHTQAQRVLIVGHGAAFSVALATLLDGNPSVWTNYEFANCGLTELVLGPDHYLDTYNITNHL
ncbi:MAG: histidine phosphatase family protein [Proteobacteria bacterium]|nr:histidine phosphatase family protein [Pseudomonadota bacterium]